MTFPPADRCRKKKTFEGGQKHVFHLPNEVFAVAAERRLLEEARNEAMVLNVVNVFLFQRTLASPVAEVQLVVRIVILIALVVSHFHSSRSAFFSFLFMYPDELHSRLTSWLRENSGTSLDLCSQRRDFQCAWFTGQKPCNAHDGVSLTDKSTFPTNKKKGKTSQHAQDEGESTNQSH